MALMERARLKRVSPPGFSRDAAMSMQGPRNRLLAHSTRQLDPAVARDGRIVDRDIVLVTRPCEVVSNCTDNAEPICSTGGDPPSKTFLLLDDRSRQRGPRGADTSSVTPTTEVARRRSPISASPPSEATRTMTLVNGR